MTRNTKTSRATVGAVDVRAGGCVSSAPSPARPPARPSTISADDVLAQALSIIRGRVFGRRSTEVQLIRVTLRNHGFEIVETGTSP